MIEKGSSFHETFIVEKAAGAVSVSGTPTAHFGYKRTSGQSRVNDGVWVDWVWSGNQFELRNDRHGFYPMFHHLGPNGLIVSNDITELIKAGCSIELDDAAIAVFLRLGFYIGDDTPFKAIRAVPAGANFHWDSDGFLAGSDSRPLPQSDGAPPSRDAAVTKYGELFESAIEQFDTGEHEKVAVPLSGGRDSRHILFALLKASRRPDSCITVRHIPPKTDEDAVIASQVAQFDGLNHVILPRATDLLGIELEKNRLTNFCADQHAWILPLRHHLTTHSFTTVFDGIGGDVLSASGYLNEERLRLYREGRLKALAEGILGPEGYLPRIIRPEFYEKWSRETAINHLIPELEKHVGSPNPVGQFYFWNRTRRGVATSSWGILNDRCHVFAPYLSGEIYDFLAALPASYLLGRTFHTEAIARHYPEHAHLPYETRRLPRRRSGRMSVACYLRDVIRYCFFSEDSGKHINTAFFAPRVVRGLINAEYGTHLRGLFSKPVYLTQLEQSRTQLPHPRPSSRSDRRA